MNCRLLKSRTEKKRAVPRRRRGAATIIALMFVCLFAVLATSFSGIMTINLRTSQSHRDIVMAQAAADSGLAFAHHLVDDYLENTPSGPAFGSTPEERSAAAFNAFCDHVISTFGDTPVMNGQSPYVAWFVDADLQSGSILVVPQVNLAPGHTSAFALTVRQYNDAPEILEVSSGGFMNDVTRTVMLNYSIEAGVGGFFDFALFAKDGLDLVNSVTVDSYNDPDDEDWMLQVGTNSVADSAVSLNNSIIVDGDVLVGAGGDPNEVVSMNNSIELTGETGSLPVNQTLPEVIVPEDISSGPSLGPLTDTTTLTTSGKYSSINLGNNEVLTIAGDVTLYITADIDFGNGATLEIAPGATLKLYVEGSIHCRNSTEINNLTHEPRNLQIYGLTDTDLYHLNNSVDWYGTIYAPGAQVHLNNSIDFYGALVAGTVKLNNSVDFYYDASLQDFTPEGTTGNIDITRQGDSYYEL